MPKKIYDLLEPVRLIVAKKELRNRILFTLGLVILCRFAAVLPCPGVDPEGLARLFDSLRERSGMGGVLDVFNLFTGGALERFAVGGLGIMPYITASIILSLCTPIFGHLQNLKRMGESGYQTINQYTRYLTLLICIVQGFVLAASMEHAAGIMDPAESSVVVTHPGPVFRASTVIILTCGTMLLVWLGDLITDHGIGNGASIIITIGIVDRMPRAFYQMWDMLMRRHESNFSFIHVEVLFALFVLVTAATVALTLGERRVPLQYAQTRQMGKRAVAEFIRLKVNYANIMPIIFAGPILMIPPFLIGYLPSSTIRSHAIRVFTYGTGGYMIVYAVLIILFCFFWVASQYNVHHEADELKKRNAFIPGIRPGEETAKYLDWTMSRITAAGAIFLTALALAPMVLTQSFRIPHEISSFFGGTSLLIMVGVMLESVRQLIVRLREESYAGSLNIALPSNVRIG